MKRIEVTPGTCYGDLEVIREVESTGKRKFLCECLCGREVTARLDHLRSGHSASCGKCGIEWNGERNTIRGWARQYQIKESTLRARLKVMSLQEALERV